MEFEYVVRNGFVEAHATDGVTAAIGENGAGTSVAIHRAGNRVDDDEYHVHVMINPLDCICPVEINPEVRTPALAAHHGRRAL